MKIAFIRWGLVGLLAVAGVWSGCAGLQHGLVLDPVGPVPAHSPARLSADGSLVVYAAYEASADFNNRDPRVPEYSDYRILSTDGKLLRFVHNQNGITQHDPALVTLPAGEYQVIAHANGYNTVTVPVIIQNGRTTVVHLEGENFWPNDPGLSPTNAVLLPDGQMVGWRATKDSHP